ncbi:mucosal addressin cell adhesion molecule 1 [Vipera latastei]
MDCPGAEVEWEGLDTDLGNIISDQRQSILTLSSATINMEGTKLCSGECHGVPSVAKVELKVYSFPDTLQLDSQPKTLTVGQPARLLCSMTHVYPHGALTLSWFQGDEQLEASRETEEEVMEEEEEQLFVYRSELELPTVAEAFESCMQRNFILMYADWCTFKVTIKLLLLLLLLLLLFVVVIIIILLVPFLTDQKLTTKPLSTTNGFSTEGATEKPATKPLSTTNGFSTEGATEKPATKPLSTANGFSTEGATEKSATKPLSTANGFSTEGTTEKPATKPLSTTNGFSTEGATEKPVTKPLSMANSFSTEGTTEKPKDPCRPLIVPVPAQGTMGGALRITCQASECRRDVQIQWVETPVAQSRYRLEEAEGRSTLTVENVSLEHQGVYRCVAIASPPRIASLRVVVSAGE